MTCGCTCGISVAVGGQQEHPQHAACISAAALNACDPIYSLDVTACSRSFILHVRVLTPPAAIMVVDHKGRILHATAKLSSLLGHQVANLVKMELNQLLPQPICQMHGAWFKVRDRMCHAHNCARVNDRCCYRCHCSPGVPVPDRPVNMFHFSVRLLAGSTSTHLCHKLPCWQRGALAGSQWNQGACDAEAQHKGGHHQRTHLACCPGRR